MAMIISKNLLLYHQNWPNDQVVFGQPACFTNYLLRPQIWSSFSPSCRLYEPEAWRPRASHPAAYYQVRLGSEPLR